MERILVSDVATLWSALTARIGRHYSARVIALAVVLGGALGLMGALAGVVGTLAESETVQTIAQLLARGTPL